jgi:hypothetical protein
MVAGSLLTICEAGLEYHVLYIWFMQSSERDKRWQIRNMARIYEKCTVCFVLPRGLGGHTRIPRRSIIRGRCKKLCFQIKICV